MASIHKEVEQAKAFPKETLLFDAFVLCAYVPEGALPAQDLDIKQIVCFSLFWYFCSSLIKQSQKWKSIIAYSKSFTDFVPPSNITDFCFPERHSFPQFIGAIRYASILFSYIFFTDYFFS